MIKVLSSNIMGFAHSQLIRILNIEEKCSLYIMIMIQAYTQRDTPACTHTNTHISILLNHLSVHL